MIKIIIYTLLGLIVTFVIAYYLFVKYYPTFGGDINIEHKTKYQKSPQFRDGKFRNTANVPKELSFGETLKLAYTFFTTKVKKGRPQRDLEVIKQDAIEIASYRDEKSRLIWYGHSSFLLQMQGQNILLDPMFGKVAAPHPLLGADRFNPEMPLDVEKLPNIDAVIISHDHYDHLDYETIQKLKNKVAHFFVPLGVEVHLKAWGIATDKITILDWWQETSYNGLKLVCTPAQHFSGRKIGTDQSTLWSSWVIKSETENLYFSGDSGYAPHFKEIGEKYGPFDLALMECGQYNQMWSDIHMMPEETAQAGIDVKAQAIMPIHWGSFKLALHDWTDPITRVLKKSKALNLAVIHPQIGSVFYIKEPKSDKKWWNNY